MPNNTPHEPTKATRDTVSLHALVGTPQETIAGVLGIDAKTLRKYYREELDFALAKANATLGGTLYTKAKGGDTAALVFWLKTRAGFRERQEIEHTGSIDVNKMSDDELDRKIAELMNATTKPE